MVAATFGRTAVLPVAVVVFAAVAVVVVGASAVEDTADAVVELIFEC